jgi:hypothetical protein
MNRRKFLACLSLMMCLPITANANSKGNRQFVFKIRTKGGSITGNIVVRARNAAAATTKLMKTHEGCTVLSMDEK